jgi:DNA invertase Pin-like site-specific DNA recombinase
VFADFEHEILRVRIRAGIAEARLKGKRFGRPLSRAKTLRAFSDGIHLKTVWKKVHRLDAPESTGSLTEKQPTQVRL